MLMVKELFNEFALTVNKARANNTQTAIKYAAISYGFKGINDMPAIYLKNAEENLGKFMESKGITKDSSKYRNNKNYISYFVRWAENNGKICLNNRISPEWEIILKSIEDNKQYYKNVFKTFCLWASENYLLPSTICSEDISDYGRYLISKDTLYCARKFTNIRHVLNILMKRGLISNFNLPYIGNQPLSAKPYSLRYTAWPEKLKKEYNLYEEWVSAAVKIGRPKKHKQRMVTYQNNKARLEQFIGFLVNIRGYDIGTLDFEKIFTCENIEAFLNWLNDRLGGITETHRHMLSLFKVITLKYLKIDGDLKNFLECIDLQVDKRRDKSKNWATLKELIYVTKRIGKSISRAKSPVTIAIRNRDRLIFELLTRRALRIRNIIEGESGKNFYRTSSGEWRIAFSGRDVKASDIDMAFPQEMVASLEEYIKIHRNVIIKRHNKEVGNVLFVSSGRNGILTRRGVYSIISFYTKKYLGKTVNPHLFRSILATDIIENAPGNIDSKLMCVSNLLAHKNINTTFKHYIRANNKKSLMDVDNYLNGLSHTDSQSTSEQRDLKEKVNIQSNLTSSIYLYNQAA